MIENLLKYLERADAIISLFAVAIIVIGLSIVSVRYLYRFWKIKSKQNFTLFRVEFGNVLTLGLEILILADVIRTIIVKPTLQSLIFLIFIIAIRIIVSWTLSLETNGYWPWQKPNNKEQTHVL
tara:strand:- start:12019 stop:12390 length:372 start_codon:yes stop_codon:yes gene_type:complete